MRRVRLAHFLEQFGQRLIRQRAIAPQTGKDKVAALDPQSRAPLDDTQRSAGEGDDMLPICLHAVLGELPQPLFKVELSPRRATNLAGPGGGEDRKFEREAAE